MLDDCHRVLALDRVLPSVRTVTIDPQCFGVSLINIAGLNLNLYALSDHAVNITIAPSDSSSCR